MITTESLEILIKATADQVITWKIHNGSPKLGFIEYTYNNITLWVESLNSIVVFENTKMQDLDREQKKVIKLLKKQIRATETQKKKIKEIVKVPFRDGNQLHYPERRYRWPSEGGGYDEPEWVDNFEFDDELEIVGIKRGRSAAYFLLKSVTTGKEYTMFMKDLMEFLNGQKLKARWTFQKRGANFGVRKIKEKK
jgi:hypothetical protein